MQVSRKRTQTHKMLTVSDTVVVCTLKQLTEESVREEEGEQQDGEGMEGEGHKYTPSV